MIDAIENPLTRATGRRLKKLWHGIGVTALLLTLALLTATPASSGPQAGEVDRAERTEAGLAQLNAKAVFASSQGDAPRKLKAVALASLIQAPDPPLVIRNREVGTVAVPGVVSSSQGVFITHGNSAWMGVRVEDGTDRGVVVNSVEPESPASEAGLEPQDLITQFNGTNLLGAVQFERLVGETPVGRTVSLTISRGGQELELDVTLSERSANNVLARLHDYQVGLNSYSDALDNLGNVWISSFGGPALGLRVNSMTSELREFFGAGPDAGVLVVSIEDDSIAGAAGVQVGDVIISVDGNEVDSPNAVRNLTRAVLASGNAVTLTVLRDRSERDVVVEPSVEEVSPSGGFRFNPEIL